jgi:hypothetical protein
MYRPRWSLAARGDGQESQQTTAESREWQSSKCAVLAASIGFSMLVDEFFKQCALPHHFKTGSLNH